MKKKKIKENELRTDLILEQNPNLKTIQTKISSEIQIQEANNQNKKYTTIYFKDITDKNHFYEVQNTFIKELKSYIKPKKEDCFLMIGLGNQKTTPDALGPYTMDHILVTRYLFLLGEIEGSYSNVCSFVPDVTGNTGIETSDIIKSIIKDTQATKVIVIDALKTNDISRLAKTIQITNKGISPGSGIGNHRKEISRETMGIDVIAIGVPTVVDIQSINTNIKLKENLIVTPTNIDFLIEKLAILIGNGINTCLHQDFIRQKTD